MTQRPELRLINLEVQHFNWDNRLARNQLLPQLDLITEGSQDAGDPASSSNDKSRFELEVGLQGELPIQRRKARGKIQSTNFKMADLRQKLFFTQNKSGRNSKRLATPWISLRELSRKPKSLCAAPSPRSIASTLRTLKAESIW